MDFSNFLKKVVKLETEPLGYFYCGKVIDCDDNFLKIVDRHGREVILKISDIKNIREVSQNG